MGAQFLVADQWSEIYNPSSGTWLTRFVYDDAESRIVAMQLQKNTASPWLDATPDEVEHLEAKLEGPDQAALVHPEAWGLRVTAEAPNWAAELIEDWRHQAVPGPR